MIFYVRDAEVQTDGSYRRLGQFEARDELKQPGEPPYFGDATGDEVRAWLRRANPTLPWAGFRQSFDLTVFGSLDRLLWQFANELVLGLARETTHEAPTTLEEWERFLRFSVLCYGAYFEAFYPSGEQLVGGGADAVSVAWPE